MRKSLHLSAVAMVIATFLVSLSVASPARAAVTMSVSTSTIVVPGQKNATELIVTMSGLPNIYGTKIEFSGASFSESSGGWKSYTLPSSYYGTCISSSSTFVGAKSAKAYAGADCIITGSTFLLNLNTTSPFTDVGGTIEFRFPANSLTFASSGPYTVTASYDTATMAGTKTLTTALTPQPTLTVVSTSGTFGTPLTLSTSGGAGNGAVTYSVTNGTASGCSIANGELSASSAGTCKVTASKAADATYDSATSVATDVTLGKATRTLSFGTTTSYTLAYGATQTVTATPSAGSGDGAVTYSVSSGTACTVGSNDGLIRVVESTGSCVVSATVAQGTNYLSATTSTQVTVNGTAKTMTITGGSPTVNFGTNFTPTALDSGSKLVGTQTVDHAQTTYTFEGINGTQYGPTTVKPVNAGKYSVLPSNLVITGGSASNYDITYLPGTLTINKAPRTLSFATTAYTVAYGNTQSVIATASTGDGTITYSDGSSTACTVDSATGEVSVTSGAGTCEISASIDASTNHLEASTTSSVVITVSPRPISLTAGSPTIVVGRSFTPTNSLTSGTLVGNDEISGVTYSYAGTGSTTYTTSTTAPTAIGTYSVTPSAAVFSTGSTTNYVISYVAGTLTIKNKLSRTVSFSSTSHVAMYGDTQQVTAVPSIGSNDGALTYSSGSSTACSVDNDGLITVTAASGTCEISASISEGTDHLAASTSASVTITVSPRPISITVADLSIASGGQVNPDHSITNGSLQGPDKIGGVTFTYAGTGATTYAASTTPPTAAGTYSVTPSLAVFATGIAANYNITYIAGKLTIAAAPVVPAAPLVPAAPPVAATPTELSSPQSTNSVTTPTQSSGASFTDSQSPIAASTNSDARVVNAILVKTGSSMRGFVELAMLLLLLGGALIGSRLTSRRPFIR